MADETEQLTAAMARGDRAAVAAFYDRYYGLLCRLARRAVGRSRRDDEHLCLDVVHDAVLRVVRTVRPVPSEGQLVTWLRLVVRSAAYDLLRREQRRAAREAAAASVNPRDGSPSANDHSGAAGADLDEQLAWLRAELHRLDPRLVELIELLYQRRWTLAAIGARLGVSAGTVDGRLRRALAQVRARAREVFGELG